MRSRPFAPLLATLLALAGCTTFPAAQTSTAFDDGLSAQQVFDGCLQAHGGDLTQYDGDINLSTDGTWYSLIQRIQPVVTDAGFRIRSQERYRPRDGVYAVHHEGPAGNKHVVRTPSGITVHYNGVRESDPVKLRATAMTNDAFRMFHFGPSFLVGRTKTMTRLADAREGGRSYRRVQATLEPGFGEARSDQVVLWIDSDSARLFRIHMTLNGFETTQGAHVDTTFLEYRQVGRFVLPVRFLERVRGPVQVKAHAWHVTEVDLDRGWSLDEVSGAAFSGKAATR